ncbi:hypothetical protein CSCA_5130 [Clostridium scatologenes]|uniref:Uncharacterized protein n=1 Tax=Clostridium scatologenes TaxID=1548 RepID=A0A0E3K5B6_CLOSL|nr:hypothetical protein CSCA_5130 [Clostridium scatologenes]
MIYMEFQKIIYYSAVPVFSILFIFLLIVLIRTIMKNKK